ncbi:MAG: WYL domain-containing protein [Xanthomonadaceae bacterium]|nr:WYL domain-containing protein [Xanthomonadaceae bacterium]
MTDTLHRHWMMLQMIPRAPRKITVEDVCSRLANGGYAVTKRTVERDLQKLSATFPLVVDDRNKPYGWQWGKEALSFDLPAMDVPTALTFHFVREYIQPLLPAPVRSHLAPHIETATKTLDGAVSNSLRSWTDKVMVIPQGQMLRAPEVRHDVADTVYAAVLAEKRINIKYRPQHADGATKDYEASPLGLVMRDHVCYVVASLFEYDDILQLAMHRIDHAELNDKPAKIPVGFSLKAYVGEGAFAYPVGDRMTLVAIFDKDAAFHLGETPLSDDQILEPLEGARVRLTATVKDTQQLRWWLMSFGAKVEVKKPVALRNELAATAKALVERYAG